MTARVHIMLHGLHPVGPAVSVCTQTIPAQPDLSPLPGGGSPP